jgi:hypothetical protein
MLVSDQLGVFSASYSAHESGAVDTMIDEHTRDQIAAGRRCKRSAAHENSEEPTSNRTSKKVRLP